MNYFIMLPAMIFDYEVLSWEVKVALEASAVFEIRKSVLLYKRDVLGFQKAFNLFFSFRGTAIWATVSSLMVVRRLCELAVCRADYFD